MTLVLVGTSEIHTSVSVGTSLEVLGLTPFSTYLCSVAAHTIATGQQTEPLLVITQEDSKYTIRGLVNDCCGILLL